MRETYMDYATTMSVDPRVLEVMLPYFVQKFGNTMALYELGQESKLVLEDSRETVARAINVDAGEITFTGSATESNNLALKIKVEKDKEGKERIADAKFETCAILEELEKKHERIEMEKKR